MKPTFALDLRLSVITLLHRTAQGWIKVGEAAMGSPDFVEALGVMRATALGLSPKGITTKVIIPNAQILYTRVPAPLGTATPPAGLIDAALTNLTPYRLDELAYDWCETQSGLQVAVLAKETLEEAETFAREHRFNPVSFVAVPEAGSFTGEPFFGRSNLSTSLLAKDDIVQRDLDAVQVGAGATPQPVQAAPVAKADGVAVQTAQPSPPPSSGAEGVAKDVTHREAPKPDSSGPQPAKSAPAQGVPTQSAPAAKAPAAPRPEVSAQVITPPAPQEAPKPDFSSPQPAALAKTAPVQAAPPQSAPTAKAPAAPRPDAPEAPMVVDVEQDDAGTGKAPPITRAPKSAVPAAAVVGASSPPDQPAQAVAPTLAVRAPVPRPAGAKPAPVLAAVGRPKATRAWQAGANPAQISAIDRAGKPKVTTPAQQRRYIIMILTAVLVLLLGIIALWVALSLGTKEAKNRSAGPAAVVVQAGSAPAQAPVTPPTQSTDLAPPDGQTVPTKTADPVAAPDPVAKPDMPAPNIVAAMPDSAGQDEIFLASADTPPVSLDPIALPALEVGADSAPFLPESPPPYLPLESPPAALTPAPDGAPAPDSALAMALPTPVAPIERPQDLLPALPADTAFQTPAAPKAELLLAQDPTLAAKRPRTRPADLVAVLAPPPDADLMAPDSRYARLKPQARPSDLIAVSQDQSPQPDMAGLGTSPKPQARPRDIGTGLDDAVSVALAQVPADQPKAEAPAPTLPTSASVAKQATEKAALNVNRLALLAVFGTPTSRFAMVRLAGGRVKKVKVGDMIDGGRIAGMTADAVQYQKGGRIVTLTLPQG